ncbi:MAG: hypothetical protein J6Y77_04560 [Paludibacteraceae bacterium]|nr:hypothetical protein [Paludibacteraceae bacterium]
MSACCACAMFAQECSVYGKIEPHLIRVGEQAVLHYELVQPDNVRFSVPSFADSVCTGVELVGEPSMDTVRLTDNRIQVDIDYIVTSFDSGFYFIPSQLFEDETGFVLESKPLSLSVTTIQVNLQDAIRPEKGLMQPPFDWLGLIVMLLIVKAALLLLAVIIILVMHFVFKKRVPLLSPEPEPEIPPYEQAYGRLVEIREKKRWQLGEVKEFYTDLTDVLRTYLSKRFKISAMESTTDEILEDVKSIPEMADYRSDLKSVLEEADLVKFAKQVPFENENYQVIDAAFKLVEGTKPIEETTAPNASESEEVVS